MQGKRYQLSPGSQVREEDFGLLFYTMAGPRLYFVSCGDLINSDFFHGVFTLAEWVGHHFDTTPERERITELSRTLDRLEGKGVILEC